MGGGRVFAALAVVLLAVPLSPGAPAAAQNPGDEVPCPSAGVSRPAGAPAPPVPPAHGPGERELGGAALATAGLAVPEDVPPVPGGQLSATSWLVADLDRGTVLGGCGPHEYAVPASVQKLLLMAAFLDDLDPDQVVEVVPEDVAIEPFSSAVGLVAGGEYTIDTLWLGLMLSSGNDAANVLARVGGGEDGVEGGLRAMNEEAQRLGAYQTHAVTPSGLDGPGQFASAYDLALIARVLFDRGDFLRYAQTERTDIPAQPHVDAVGFQIQNDNQLLFQYPGALGGKTGGTDLARLTFVGAAERGGRRLVATFLGAEAQPVPAWQQAAALLDWGYSLPPDAAVGRLVEPEDVAAATSSTDAPATPDGDAAAGGERAEGGDGGAVALVAAPVIAGGGLLAALATFLLTRGNRRRRAR